MDSQTRQGILWARLYPIARPLTNPPLRQGVWYPVLNDSLGDRVVLSVRNRKVAVPRGLLEIRDKTPTRFTVVYRAKADHNPALGTAHDLGRRYAVCPSCGVRIRLGVEPPVLRCPECGHKGEVAYWETG
jgi:DNA-directed RNA polymerase subunit RPC12/RpoP